MITWFTPPWVETIALPWATGLQTSLQLVTKYDPDDDPITVELVRDHIKHADPSAEETYLQHLIVASLGMAQQKTQRSILPETYRLSLSGFPSSRMELPLPPLIDAEISYFDAAGDTQSFTDFLLNAGTGPEAGRAVISLASGVSWPTAGDFSNAVSVTFRTGYINRLVSPEEVDVPALLTHARLCWILAMYERGSGDKGVSREHNIETAEAIFFSYRDPGRAG